jgi:hypothetical protein
MVNFSRSHNEVRPCFSNICTNSRYGSLCLSKQSACTISISFSTLFYITSIGGPGPYPSLRQDGCSMPGGNARSSFRGDEADSLRFGRTFWPFTGLFGNYYDPPPYYPPPMFPYPPPPPPPAYGPYGPW